MSDSVFSSIWKVKNSKKVEFFAILRRRVNILDRISVRVFGVGTYCCIPYRRATHMTRIISCGVEFARAVWLNFFEVIDFSFVNSRICRLSVEELILHPPFCGKGLFLW